MVQYRSVSRRIFEAFLYLGVILFCLAVILPFLHVIAISFSSKDAILKNKVMCAIWLGNNAAGVDNGVEHHIECHRRGHGSERRRRHPPRGLLVPSTSPPGRSACSEVPPSS